MPYEAAGYEAAGRRCAAAPCRTSIVLRFVLFAKICVLFPLRLAVSPLFPPRLVSRVSVIFLSRACLCDHVCTVCVRGCVGLDCGGYF